MQESGLTDSFLSYAPHLSGASILRFDYSHPWLLAHHREWLQLGGWQIAGIVLPGLRNSHLEGWNRWWPWHPCYFIWQKMLHFTGYIWQLVWQILFQCSFSKLSCLGHFLTNFKISVSSVKIVWGFFFFKLYIIVLENFF